MARPFARSAKFRRFLLVAFGVVLPIVCFGLDHLGFHVYGAWTWSVRWFVGCELALFSWFLWRTPSSEFVRGGMVAAFAVGAGFAMVTGLCLLPSSVIGVVVLIGLLGLVPFGTALAYGAAVARLTVGWTEHRAVPLAAGAVVTLAVAIGPAAAWRRHEVDVARQAQAELGEEGGLERARLLLERLPQCDVGSLTSLYAHDCTSLVPGDLAQWLNWSWTDALRNFPMGFH